MKNKSYGIILWFLFFAHVLSGQNLEKITASDRAAGDNLGYSVAIYGNFAVAGAYIKDQSGATQNFGNEIGAAYVYEKSNGQWSALQKLEVINYTNSDQFGHDVAIYGNDIIVGAPGAGEAYIYDKNNNFTKTTLPLSTPISTFGHSVAISDGIAVIGAPNNGSGSARIYEKGVGGSWGHVFTLTAPSGVSSIHFGQSVSISNNGDNIAIGTNNEDVHIFERNGSSWIHKITFQHPNGPNITDFGNTVAIGNHTLVVGAAKDDFNSMTNSGAVFIYSKNTSTGNWALQTDLRASDAVSNGLFGYSVAVHGNKIIVGLGNDGDAYTYSKVGNNWEQEEKYSYSSLGPSDKFGHAVDIYNNDFVIGAPSEYYDSEDQSSLSSAGAIYFPGTACGNIVLTTPITQSTGYSEGSITASNVVGNTTLYKASDFILLKTGFQVNAGISFRGYLGPCDGILYRPAMDDNTPHTINNELNNRLKNAKTR